MRQKAYYTADETFYNLYTTGQEWMTEDFVEYKGAYHSYITGETYTQSTWRPGVSVKLIKFEQPDPATIQYKKLNDVNVKYKTIVSFYPVITKTNLAAKYIIRYFIKKINETTIIEIDEPQYADWVNKKIDPNLYVAVKLIWQIAGSLTSTNTNGALFPSVAAANQQRVNIAERTMPGLSAKLTNLIEFYSDTDYIAPVDINS